MTVFCVGPVSVCEDGNMAGAQSVVEVTVLLMTIANELENRILHETARPRVSLTCQVFGK
jgi:hypothetical protein